MFSYAAFGEPFLPAAKTGLFAVPRLTRSILCFAKYAFGAATIPCPCGLAGEKRLYRKAGKFS